MFTCYLQIRQIVAISEVRKTFLGLFGSILDSCPTTQ